MFGYVCIILTIPYEASRVAKSSTGFSLAYDDRSDEKRLVTYCPNRSLDHCGKVYTPSRSCQVRLSATFQAGRHSRRHQTVLCCDACDRQRRLPRCLCGQGLGMCHRGRPREASRLFCWLCERSQVSEDITGVLDGTESGQR